MVLLLVISDKKNIEHLSVLILRLPYRRVLMKHIRVIKKKRGSLYLLLVLLTEALALPITVERATQKPTPKYASMLRRSHDDARYISHIGHLPLLRS